jgi:divalent metal cation (Fe/Co/Zn/Cd) transporter
MEIISPGWFIWHALIGAGIGFGLRVFEHVVWSSTQEEPVPTFQWAIMFAPLCFVVGATLAYISLLFFAPVIRDGTAITFSAYLLSAFWAFLSLDVRNFLRRH